MMASFTCTDILRVPVNNYQMQIQHLESTPDVFVWYYKKKEATVNSDLSENA